MQKTGNGMERTGHGGEGAATRRVAIKQYKVEGLGMQRASCTTIGNAGN